MIKSKDREMPLEGIVTCKDCEYWNKKTEYCKHWIGRTEDAYYTVYTGADFYCEDAVRKEENK